MASSNCWFLVVLLLGAAGFGSTEAKPRGSNAPCQVLNESLICRTNSSGSGWIVIQQRFDGSVNFNRDWDEYRDGFGEVAPDKEFWWGLERIHQLTKTRNYELLIELRDEDGEFVFARYSHFVVAGEWKQYKMTRLQGYSGTAGNVRLIQEIQVPKGQKFSTVDFDNDDSLGNCAAHFGGGWWYNNCGQGLNSNWGEHATWHAWNNKPLTYTRMSIRARQG